MPHLNDLIPINRPVNETDQMIIETQDGTRRIQADLFKGTTGETGEQGRQGEQGIQGETGAKGADGGGGGGSTARQAVTLTSILLANNGHELGVIHIAKSSEIIRVILATNCRIRLYDTAAARDADINRTVNQSAITGQGLILDVNCKNELIQNLDPHAQASNQDEPPTDAIYYTLTNFDIPRVILVGFVYLTKEI